jgi:hypothetical protein
MALGVCEFWPLLRGRAFPSPCGHNWQAVSLGLIGGGAGAPPPITFLASDCPSTGNRSRCHHVNSPQIA